MPIQLTQTPTKYSATDPPCALVKKPVFDPTLVSHSVMLIVFMIRSVSDSILMIF